MRRRPADAVPYDIPGAVVTHRGERCSFDALIEDFALSDPALDRLAYHHVAARKPDTSISAPQSAGLVAASLGLSPKRFSATTRCSSTRCRSTTACMRGAGARPRNGNEPFMEPRAALCESRMSDSPTSVPFTIGASVHSCGWDSSASESGMRSRSCIASWSSDPAGSPSAVSCMRSTTACCCPAPRRSSWRSTSAGSCAAPEGALRRGRRFRVAVAGHPGALLVDLRELRHPARGCGHPLRREARRRRDRARRRVAHRLAHAATPALGDRARGACVALALASASARSRW